MSGADYQDSFTGDDGQCGMDNVSTGDCILVANKFIIQNQIGKGSFGEVYKGYNKDTKEQVAVKIVKIIFILWQRFLIGSGQIILESLEGRSENSPEDAGFR